MTIIFSQAAQLYTLIKFRKSFRMRLGPKTANLTTFKNEKNCSGFTKFFNKSSLLAFAFMFNLFRYINKLTTKLIRKGNFVFEMYSVVKA